MLTAALGSLSSDDFIQHLLQPQMAFEQESTSNLFQLGQECIIAACLPAESLCQSLWQTSFAQDCLCRCRASLLQEGLPVLQGLPQPVRSDGCR